MLTTIEVEEIICDPAGLDDSTTILSLVRVTLDVKTSTIDVDRCTNTELVGGAVTELEVEAATELVGRVTKELIDVDGATELVKTGVELIT